VTKLAYNDNIKIKISGSRGYFFLKRDLAVEYNMIARLGYNENIEAEISGSRGYFFLKRASVI
jgi:hypothetical protein